MTVLSSEQLLGSSTRQLPRVNLLPPEIAEQARVRKVQAGLGVCLLGSAAVVAALFVSATHGVSSANSELAAAKAEKTQLQGQIVKYRDVTAIYAQADAARAQLRTAMWDEVRYSQVLNDLSLSVSSNVWLKNLAIAPAGPTASAAGAASGTPSATAATAQSGTALAAGQLAGTPVATLTVQGVGFSHDDVAAWLDSLAGVKHYTDPYFSNSTEALLGSRPTVNFSSTATINGLALSGRYTRRG